MQTAIVGGGAAGFFLAVNLKERAPQMRVVILEAGQHVLRKVRVSGGGRCNVTNTFAGVDNLAQVYPRGHRLMKHLLHSFSPQDAYAWFERHGVPLTIQPDGCVFPRSQQSQSIIDCLLGHARRLGVEVVTGQRVTDLDTLHEFDFVAVTTGGSLSPSPLPEREGTSDGWVDCCPSLFTFSIDDAVLHTLMGTVVEGVSVQLAGTKFRASGPLLVTHWGMSGPSILRLSSYAARHFHDGGYKATLSVNWLSATEAEVKAALRAATASHTQRQVSTQNPFGLPSRLWQYLLQKAGIAKRWGELTAKDQNRLANLLVNDTYTISGRAPFRDEFVTCGGVSLSSLNPQTLESRTRPGTYFAGEVLDIDGVTGGFNFQCAWTTAYVVAQAISRQAQGETSPSPF
jgi:predicted flavoprotein YhiN